MPTTRRDERREETIREILDLAWQQVEAEGAANLSLREISREMRMSSPAIFRYFANRDALLTALSLDAVRSLNRRICAARDAVAPLRPVTRLTATCLAYRGWAIENPAKFLLAYSAPASGAQPDWTALMADSQRTLEIFIDLILAASPMQDRGEPPKSVFIVAGAREQIEAICRRRGYPVQSEILSIALSGWMRLFGVITLEINQQIQPLLADPALFYQNEIAQLLSQLGCDARAD